MFDLLQLLGVSSLLFFLLFVRSQYLRIEQVRGGGSSDRAVKLSLSVRKGMGGSRSTQIYVRGLERGVVLIFLA